ncbi:MAG: SVM family protein ['Waltheria sp.' little leaf phytoplasma]|nr:SVM family protein ['Waltheria sp.' little leaf phytoplasma]
MFKLQNLSICLFIFLELLLIFHNNPIMAMGNKNSNNNNEISNDQEYVLYLKEEFIIQNELTNLTLCNDKKEELLRKQKCITTEINKYNKRNNNQLLINDDNQPESSRQNIISITENDKDDSSSDEIQCINLNKSNYNTHSIDKPECSKKNDNIN